MSGCAPWQGLFLCFVFKKDSFHFHHTNVILFGSQEAQERKERRAKRFGLQAKQKDTEKDDSHSEDDPDTV